MNAERIHAGEAPELFRVEDDLPPEPEEKDFDGGRPAGPQNHEFKS